MPPFSRRTIDLKILLKGDFMLRRTSLKVLQVERKSYKDTKDHDPGSQSGSFLLYLIEILNASQDSIS